MGEVRASGATPHPLRGTAYAAGPLCRCATSPHTVGSHPSRGATGRRGTPPPTRNYTISVGASIARPGNPAPPHNPPGGYRIRPYANQNLAPEGSNGEGRKSVKKRAALLHVLAFPFLDHPFGVPRGRAPWAVPRAPEVAGLFCFSFGHKREGLSAAAQIKKGLTARW